MKKIMTAFLLTVLLTVLCAFGTVSASAADMPTEAEVYSSLIAMKSQYPEGMTWNEENTYIRGDGQWSHACAAFANILSETVFGSFAEVPSRNINDPAWSSLHVGDILEDYTTSPGHNMVVLEVYDSYAVIAEGNYNGKIHWGRTISRTTFEAHRDAGDIVIETRWPVGTFNCATVTYAANDGSGATFTECWDVSSSAELTDNDPERFGYSFLGWSTNPKAVKPEYKKYAIHKIGDEANWLKTGIENVHDMTLYAVWQKSDLSSLTALSTAGECQVSFSSAYTFTPEESDSYTLVCPYDSFASQHAMYAAVYDSQLQPVAEKTRLPVTVELTAGKTYYFDLSSDGYSVSAPVRLRTTCYHTWNEGTVLKNYCENGSLVQYTCTSCGRTRSVTVNGSGESFLFDDVRKTGDYFFDPVYWAYYHTPEQITSGTSAATFSPNATCTRAQVVTFLWRAAGKPAADGANPFVDVKSSDYFYNAVLWAVQEGITNGTDSTHFSPNAKCTRGQVVTFMYRAEHKTAVGSSGNPFADVKTSDYYYNPVLWAVEQGITNGTDSTHFSPNASCTRGQVVTFLYRYRS